MAAFFFFMFLFIRRKVTVNCNNFPQSNNLICHHYDRNWVSEIVTDLNDIYILLRFWLVSAIFGLKHVFLCEIVDDPMQHHCV